MGPSPSRATIIVIPFVQAARTLRGGTPLRRQMQGLERDRAPARARTLHADQRRHDMDHYADDRAALTAHLDLQAPSTSGTPPVAAKSCTTSPDTVRAAWRKRY